MKSKVADVDFSTVHTFYGCYFSTSNRIEDGTIDQIFKIFLVRSDEIATVKVFEKIYIDFHNYQAYQEIWNHLVNRILGTQIATLEFFDQ